MADPLGGLTRAKIAQMIEEAHDRARGAVSRLDATSAEKHELYGDLALLVTWARFPFQRAAAQETPAATGTAPGQFPGPGLVGVEQSLRQAAEPLNPEHYDKPVGAEPLNPEHYDKPVGAEPLNPERVVWHGDFLRRDGSHGDTYVVPPAEGDKD